MAGETRVSLFYFKKQQAVGAANRQLRFVNCKMFFKIFSQFIIN